MSGRPNVWTDPKLDRWVVEQLDAGLLTARQMYAAAKPQFKINRPFSSFRLYVQYMRDTRGHLAIPVTDTPDVAEHVLRVPWKTVLVTGDYQIPYHDEALVEKAFKLGAAWKVEGHVFNADVFDMATVSKFPAQLFGERVQLGEELQIGREIIKESKRLHRNLAFNTGNHEWRLFVKLLHGELDTDQIREILVGEGVLYTPLSYLWLGYDAENAVRVTHPKSQSVIAGAVGADIARNHDCHVIVAHDHLLAQRRSHSGRWTVTHAGMMANPNKLLYAVTADDRRPRMNQGFVIVHLDREGKPIIRLIDPKNCDWDLEFWTARRENVD